MRPAGAAADKERDMNRTIRVLALAGLCLASGLLQAAPITRNFSATGFDGGGTLSGSFTGEDTGGTSGVIEASLDPLFNELTAFEVSYSGGTLVSAFTLNLTDFLGGLLSNSFSFLTSDESLGFALRSGTFGAAYAFGPAFPDVTEAFGLVASSCDPTGVDSCENFDSNYAIPEPGTLSLLGLAVFGLARRRMRASRG